MGSGSSSKLEPQWSFQRISLNPLTLGLWMLSELTSLQQSCFTLLFDREMLGTPVVVQGEITRLLKVSYGPGDGQERSYGLGDSPAVLFIPCLKMFNYHTSFPPPKSSSLTFVSFGTSFITPGWLFTEPFLSFFVLSTDNYAQVQR